MDEGRPPDREHRRRAVVHPGQSPHHQARGLAGHASSNGAGFMLKPAGFFDQQPGARCGPEPISALLAVPAPKARIPTKCAAGRADGSADDSLEPWNGVAQRELRSMLAWVARRRSPDWSA